MFEKYKKVYKADYEKWYKENEAYRERVAADQDRLKFHLMPKTGWLNDPNGLCQFNGTYHIYYQYTPFEPTGELKTWGHYTTKDFIHYEDFGPVVFPDEDIDAHGVYSGSAFIEDDTIHYFYTGNLKYFDRDDYDYINSGRGSNTITFTSKDGYEFTKKELLMTTSHYQAARENLFGHVPFLQRRMPGMLIRDLGGALLVDSGLGSDTFNKVLWECGGDGRPCRVERGAEDGLLQASKDWFAGKRPRDLLELPGMALPPATERPFTVWASAEDEGALNRQRTAFGRNGYGIGELETGMALPLNRWTPEGRPPEGLRIVQVGTSAELSAYADVLAANWNPPDEDVKRLYKAAEQVLFQAVAPMRLFVGFAGEVPVVSGELFLSEKGNTAGLHMISTREAFRRRGFGGAMTAALLRAGQAAGASLAVLQASSEGEPVYRRQGFEPCGLFVEYVLSEEILF